MNISDFGIFGKLKLIGALVRVPINHTLNGTLFQELLINFGLTL